MKQMAAVAAGSKRSWMLLKSHSTAGLAVAAAADSMMEQCTRTGHTEPRWCRHLVGAAAGVAGVAAGASAAASKSGQ